LATGQMQALGFEHLADLKGGIVAWVKAGKGVEK
jgi:rhodanese-related sulfurtransferase